MQEQGGSELGEDQAKTHTEASPEEDIFTAPVFPTSDDLWSYSLVSKQWQTINTKSMANPPARWLHTAVVLKGKMVICGGVSHRNVILGDVWIYTPRTRTWVLKTPSGPPFLPREGHSAVAYDGDKMIVFGGVSYGYEPFNDVWQYDMTLNSWTILRKPSMSGAVPVARWMHTAVMTDATSKVNGKVVKWMVVYGGVTRDYVPLNDVFIFRVDTKRWFRKTVVSWSDVPQPRMLHTSVLVGSTMFIMGGVFNNVPLEDVWQLDLSKGVWEETRAIGGFPMAREGASLVKVVPTPLEEDQKVTPPPWTPPPMGQVSNTETGLRPRHGSERPVPRYRKQFQENQYLLLFGGAGVS